MYMSKAIEITETYYSRNETRVWKWAISTYKSSEYAYNLFGLFLPGHNIVSSEEPKSPRAVSHQARLLL